MDRVEEPWLKADSRGAHGVQRGQGRALVSKQRGLLVVGAAVPHVGAVEERHDLLAQPVQKGKLAPYPVWSRPVDSSC